jgi:ABC-type lipoprotein release transport system permease subunit
VAIWEPSVNEWKAATMVGVNSSTDFSYLDPMAMGQVPQLRVNSSDVVVDTELNLTIGNILKVKTINFTTAYNLTTAAFDLSNSSEEIDFHVVGIYHPVQMGASQGNSHTIFIDLAKAQNVLSRKEKVDYVIVKLANTDETDNAAKDLEKLGTTYVITPVKENILATMGQAATGFQSGLQIMSILTVSVAVVIILNTIYLNVSERTYEIGILRSIGSSKQQIFWLFFSESMTLGIIGVAIGLLLSLPFAYGFTALSSQLSNTLMPPAQTLTFKPWHLIIGTAAGLIATAIGGLFPSVFASRIDVIKALRPAIRKAGKQRTALGLIGAGLPMTALSVFFFTNLSGQSGNGSYSGLYTLSTIIPLLMGGLICLAAGLLRALNPAIEHILILFGQNRILISRNIGRNLSRSTICFTLIAMTLSFIIVVAGAQGGVVTGLEDVIHSFYSADLTITSEISINTTFASNLMSMDNGSLIANVAPALVVPRTVFLANNVSDTNSSSMLIAVDSTYPKVMALKFNSETPANVFSKLETNGTIILTSPLAKSLNANVNDTIDMPVVSIVQVPITIPINESSITGYTGSYSEYSGSASEAYQGNGASSTSGYSTQMPRTTTIYVPQAKTTHFNFTIIGIAVGSMLEWNHGLYNSPLSEACYISYKSLNYTFPEYNETANLFFAKIQPNEKVDSVESRVIELYGSKYFLSTLTVDDALNPAKDGIDRTFTMLNAVVMFAVVNAAIGVAAIMIMNISERRREIGILRSLGMSKSQVVILIIGEAAVLASVGFAIGTIAGLILNRVTIGFMQIAGFPIPYTIPFNSIWLSLFLAMLSSFISAAYPAYRASKLKIVDSLRH